MLAIVFSHEEDSASNGGGSETGLCVGGKIHLRLVKSWFDQSGCEENAVDSVEYNDFRPCDGSCRTKTEQLPRRVAEVVRQILEDGDFSRVPRDGFRKERYRYPEGKAAHPNPLNTIS